MSNLTIPPEVHTVLAHLTEVTELRDTEGNLIGVFTPADVKDAKLYEKARPLFNLEQARQRVANEPHGRTTEEVLANLQRTDSRQ